MGPRHPNGIRDLQETAENEVDIDTTPILSTGLIPSHPILSPSQVGLADYQELAKGQMLGGADGFLKLIFHTETLKLLGVHCIGDGATEIIHIGQASLIWDNLDNERPRYMEID